MFEGVTVLLSGQHCHVGLERVNLHGVLVTHVAHLLIVVHVLTTTTTALASASLPNMTDTG